MATPPLVLVTGISGAGKSSALKALEDLGYETVDNVPLGFLGKLAAPARPGRGATSDARVTPRGVHSHDDSPARPLAVGIDIRTRGFDAGDLLFARREKNARLVFMDAADEVLQRRYAETRHRHPLAGSGPLLDGIRRERKLLRAARARADLVVDTSEFGPGELKHVFAERFGVRPGAGMAVFVTSFAYRKGLPREADLVFDVRFLRNPHYVPELKPLTGRDRAVADYVRRDRHFPGVFRRLILLLEPLLPLYASEGKSYLTIAVGCTGGRHRSVYVAEKLAHELERRNIRVELRHRDLAAGAPAPAFRRKGPRRKSRRKEKRRQ
jgi:UPF0042 nucleotide-binding protein